MRDRGWLNKPQQIIEDPLGVTDADLDAILAARFLKGDSSLQPVGLLATDDPDAILLEYLGTADPGVQPFGSALLASMATDDPVRQQKMNQWKRLLACPKFELPNYPEAMDYAIGDIIRVGDLYWTPNRERSAWVEYVPPEGVLDFAAEPR